MELKIQNTLYQNTKHTFQIQSRESSEAKVPLVTSSTRIASQHPSCGLPCYNFHENTGYQDGSRH